MNNKELKNFGLVDKEDQNKGLKPKNASKEIVVRKNLLFVDTRDCVGPQSLRDAQLAFKGRGGRDKFSKHIKNVTGEGVAPISIELDGINNKIRNNDEVSISQVLGNTAANGLWRITNVSFGINTNFDLIGSIGNGNYTGGGLIIRPADQGYPEINITTTNTIFGNEMQIELIQKLYVIRSISLIHAIIPRDIIPLEVYLPDIIMFSQVNNNEIPKTPSVRLATTIAGTLISDYNVGDIIDGIVLVENDRILIKNQGTASENGIYYVQNVGAPNRSNDMFTGMSVAEVTNYFVYVEEGDINKNSTWVCRNATGAVGVGNLTFVEMDNQPVVWDSFIIPTKEYIIDNLLGFYSTPLEIFRSYSGSFALPNQYTPEPLNLWNPDLTQGQLEPYPYQTVPTYKCSDFSIIGRSGFYRIINGGYGIYDLNDWTIRTGVSNLVNRILTDVARSLLLLIITPNQYYRDQNLISLIVNSNKTSNNLPEEHYGYGDYQRFLPGPGIGMHYQPGTSDGADPTISSVESPIAFPNFRGNVWGPYDSPGDRFQRMGVRDTLQDLYLNGDLENIFGSSFLKPWVYPSQLSTDVTFGFYFPNIIELTFLNIEDSTNPNITNAMRIKPNGFGAINRIAHGNNTTYTWKFRNAGGQGPSFDGIPQDGYNNPSDGGAWVDTEVINGSTTGKYNDPIGSGSLYIPDGTSTMTAPYSDASYVGNETTFPNINRRQAWYDNGINEGTFIEEILRYRNWAITELPDTNIILHIFQTERDRRIQSTNNETIDTVLSCPIRLNLGTTSGTQEYIESVQSLLANSSEYWEKRYYSPISSLSKLNIEFNTFEGTPIDLERMLQTRRSAVLLRTFEEIFGEDFANYFSIANPRDQTLSFLFDPLDPRLLGRTKRNISLIFRIETYEYDSPGLLLNTISGMLDKYVENDNRSEKFIVRASNYEEYSS